LNSEERSLLVLAHIGELLAGKGSPEKTLKKCLPQMARVLGVDSAGVYLLREAEAKMELLYTFGVSQCFAAAVASARTDRGLLGQVFKTGRPVVLRRFSPRYSLASSIKEEGLKSIAYIPIRAGGRPRGVLCLSNHKPCAFRKPTLRLSLALARQIGSAWERAMVSGQAERRRSQLESLSGLSLAFGSAQNPTHLFKWATRKAKTLLAADWAGIRVLEGDRLTLVAEVDSRLGLKPSLRIGESLAGRVILLKRPLMVTDMSTATFQIPEHKAAVIRRGYKAFLGVPLKFMGQVMGVLSVVERKAKEFSGEEISLLEGVAEQAGLAFHKLKLLEEKEILQKFLSEIHLLDLQTLLDRLTQRVVAFFKADVSAVRLLNSNKQLMIQSLAGPSDLVTKIQSEVFIDLVGGRHEWILKHRRPLLSADLQRDKRFPYHGSLKAIQASGFAGVPLIGREEKVLGLLTVITLSPRRFQPDELRFLRELAAGASIAIEETLLIDALSNTLHSKVEFLNTLSHDLRIPLDVIIGNSALIEDGFFGPVTPEQNGRIRSIKRNAEDLLGMLNQVLSLSRLDAGRNPMNIEEFVLGNLVSELGDDASALAKTKGLELRWEVKTDCSVRGDRHKIKEILHNLLTNAVKYTEKGHVGLRAGLETGGEEIWFEVSDTGRGISVEELPCIFESFRQVGSPLTHRQGGVGLGLSIVKRLMDLMGGRIEVKSTVNEGSSFKVILPRIFLPQTK
jgi:signal transduction histidine kinase/putative methionine-R-sulfoxide reductase with GAF domain